jgi:hypothetical protein
MASVGEDNGFTKAMRTVCDGYLEISVAEPDLNHRIADVLTYFIPDLVFIQIQATGITQASIEAIKATGAYTINWSGDCRSPLPQFYIDMESWGVDLTCFSNEEDVATMRALGYQSEFLQIGYDPEIYKPDGEKYPSPEIVFMGNNCGGFPLSEMRQQMVSFLKMHYGDNFGVYGSGWGGFESGNYMGDQYGEACIYRNAKIGINLSHFDYDRYTSDRMFRMLGSGICVLSHQYKGIEIDFSRNLCRVDYWNTLDELKSEIDKIINDAELLMIFGENGHQLALNNYTFSHMASNIISLWKTHA